VISSPPRPKHGNGSPAHRALYAHGGSHPPGPPGQLNSPSTATVLPERHLYRDRDPTPRGLTARASRRAVLSAFSYTDPQRSGNCGQPPCGPLGSARSSTGPFGHPTARDRRLTPGTGSRQARLTRGDHPSPALPTGPAAASDLVSAVRFDTYRVARCCLRSRATRAPGPSVTTVETAAVSTAATVTSPDSPSHCHTPRRGAPWPNKPIVAMHTSGSVIHHNLTTHRRSRTFSRLPPISEAHRAGSVCSSPTS